MDNQSVIYLFFAILMICIGVYYFLHSFSAKKKNVPELEQLSDKNIVPRDQRDALLSNSSQPVVNGELPITQKDMVQLDSAAVSADLGMPGSQARDGGSKQPATGTQSSSANKTDVDQLGETLSSLEHATADIQTVSKSDASGNLLDAHLQEQEMQDQNSALRNAAEVVSLTVLPQNSLMNFDGDTVLQILDAYGLKFGEMNLFHRYEESDGSGPLLFSVMRYAERDGTQPFDLQTLSDETVDGLTFFLPLPHPRASAGIGAMLSMSGSMARDLNAIVYDEDFEPLDRKGRDALREFVTDYQVAS